MPRHLPFIAILVVQAGTLGYIAGEQLYVRATGDAVTLRTAPIDPYDLMSGYYLDLAYEIEDAAAARAPTGLEEGERIWLTVRKTAEAWQLVSVTREPPTAKAPATALPPRPLTPQAAAAEEVSLPAVWRRNRVHLRGAHRIYLPESQRERAEALLREHPDRGRVDLRVRGGTIAVIRLRLAGESFGE